jgi:hypothetical protein
MTIRKIINGERSRPHKPPKDKWAFSFLGGWCGSLCHRRWPFFLYLNLSCWDIYNGIGNVLIGVLMCLHDLFIFSYFFLSPFSSQITRRTEKREKKNKTRRHTNNITTNTIRKISMIEIHRHQLRSPTVIGINIRIVLNLVTLYIWMTCVAHFIYYWFLGVIGFTLLISFWQY